MIRGGEATKMSVIERATGEQDEKRQKRVHKEI
jgi:hypothetical protein